MNSDDPLERDDVPLRDLLDALRAEWRDESNDDELPPESLEDCDPSTRQSVAWLRQAWALETPSIDVLPPVAVAQAAALLRSRRRATKLPRAIGVLMAVAAAVALLIVLGRGRADRLDDVIDTPLATGTRESAIDPQPGLHPGLHPDPGAVAPKTEFPPDQFRSRDDGIELVSGSVRLVLLTRDD